MSSRKVKTPRQGNCQVTEQKLDTENRSSIIDAMIRCTQARLNLVRGFSELEAELDIDDESQQVDMADEESGVTHIQVCWSDE